MSLEKFKDRNIGQQNYKMLDLEPTPATSWGKFKRTVNRSFKLELFVGLGVTFGIMVRTLFMGKSATIRYPFEKIPISKRYRAIHEMKRLLESGHYRCIGCGLCEKICISNCISMDTRYDENQRKEVSEYTINFGRCIFVDIVQKFAQSLRLHMAVDTKQPVSSVQVFHCLRIC